MRRIGIVGYGSLGKNLTEAVSRHPDMELAFVWNRSKDAFEDSPLKEQDILECLGDVASRNPDLIVEVAHPIITKHYGQLFLKTCDYLIGSPTAMSDKELNSNLRQTATQFGHSLYVPSGAFWGGEDILKMADQGTIHGLTITMRKHPSSFKLTDDLQTLNDEALKENKEKVIYEGPVKDLCPKAPNNVNTMAAAAIAAHNLGFEKTIGRLVADPKLQFWHIVEVRVEGPIVNDRRFTVETVRKNPANPGAVTGSATYVSFLSSILRAKGKGPGVHLC